MAKLANSQAVSELFSQIKRCQAEKQRLMSELDRVPRPWSRRCETESRAKAVRLIGGPRMLFLEKKVERAAERVASCRSGLVERSDLNARRVRWCDVSPIIRAVLRWVSAGDSQDQASRVALNEANKLLAIALQERDEARAAVAAQQGGGIERMVQHAKLIADSSSGDRLCLARQIREVTDQIRELEGLVSGWAEIQIINHADPE